ncbi:MAG: hypothetical protein ACJAS9_000910 [Polaribacter sp.]|jgi:hypothetical protein
MLPLIKITIFFIRYLFDKKNENLKYALLPFSATINNLKTKLEKNIFTGQSLQQDSFFFDQIFNLISQEKKFK